MSDTDHESLPLRAVDELEPAAGIGGGYDGRVRGPDVAKLAVRKLTGHLRLGEVVDAGAGRLPPLRPVPDVGVAATRECRSLQG
jgi:hypothetical protein